jgi:hypothetical protein
MWRLRRGEQPGGFAETENESAVVSRDRESEVQGEPGLLSRLGVCCQIAGMALLPVGVAGNLSPVNPLSVSAMMTLTAAGVVLFLVGVALRRAGGRA